MTRLSALIFLFLLCAAQPAAAHMTAYAAGQGPVSSIEVGVEVRASVQGRCGFAAGGAPSGQVSQADFDRVGFSRDFAIVLNCTGASRIAVASRNGGLTPESSDPGFAAVAPYQVQLRMVGDDGAAVSDACAASALTTGACAFAGRGDAATGLRLGSASTKANGSYLRVSAPAYQGSAPLAAGRYSDTLTITVSAAP
jgi:hypothetical protein